MFDLFSNFPHLVLATLISISLYMIMCGFREMDNNPFHGMYYLSLAFFFSIAHLIFLKILPLSFLTVTKTLGPGMWNWVVVLLAPSLVILFLMTGLYSLIRSLIRTGFIKIFFGLSLVCFLYLLGPGWPLDVKGIITLLWVMTWYKVELASTI